MSCFEKRDEKFESIFNAFEEYAIREGFYINKKKKKANYKIERKISKVLLLLNVISLILIIISNEFNRFTFFTLFLCSFLSLIGLFFWFVIKEIFFALLGIERGIDYKKFKRKIIPKYVNLINNNLIYIPEKKLNPLVYDEMKKIYCNETTFEEKPYVRRLNDYIEGEVAENIFLKMCDLSITIKSTNSDKNIELEGQFAYVELLKSTNVNMKILTDTIENISNFEKLEMDSVKFEEYFNVYADNKLEGMKILTADLMDLLIQFRENFDFEIEINKNKLYLRFFTETILEYTSNKEKYYDYYCILKFVFYVSQKIANNINLKSDIY